MGTAQVFNPSRPGEPAESLTGRDPPLAGPILKGELVPAPAEVVNACREFRPDAPEAAADHLVDAAFVGADDAQPSLVALEDRLNAVPGEAIRFSEHREPVPCESEGTHRATDPDVVLFVRGHRLDGNRPEASNTGDERTPARPAGHGQFTEPGCCSDQQTTIGRPEQRFDPIARQAIPGREDLSRIRFVAISGKRRMVEAVPGADPQSAIGIFEQRMNAGRLQWR